MNGERLTRIQVAEVAGQGLADDLAEVAVVGPGDPGRQVVGDDHVAGDAFADVLDGDGEDGVLTGADRAVRGGLGDLDVGAQDRHVRVVVVATVVAGRDDRGVVDDAAVGCVRRAGNVDEEAVTRRHEVIGAAELVRGEARVDEARHARSVTGRRSDGPDNAGREVVGDEDARGVAVAVVRNLDVKPDRVAGADRSSRVRRLRDQEVRAIDDDRVGRLVVAQVLAGLVGGSDGGRVRELPQSAATVPRLTVIVRDAPLARSPKSQLSRLVPLIAQSASLAPLSVHAPAGSWSVRVTSNATPAPDS